MAVPLRELDALPEHPAPEIDLDAHTLEVGGRVDAPRAYRVGDLREMASTVHTEDFDCLEGWVVPDQQWEGVPLVALIEQAAPLPEATHVSVGYGDFNIVLPIDEARQSLLALSLDGAPLSVTHGGPVRLVVPGGECFTSIKWVDRITLCTEDDGIEGTARGIAMRRIGLDPEA